MRQARHAFIILAICVGLFSAGAVKVIASGEASAKPSPDNIIAWLKEGNNRFVQGKSDHPHADANRITLADTENQGKHALATVLSCSDSRVPPEILFDAGIMDVFVVRVAGNVANTDEIGSVEYGLCHVNTPVLVVLGHTQCGAVTAVTQEVTGHGHPLERNIPPMVAPIVPAVTSAMAEHPGIKDDALINSAIEANVWEVIKNIFLKSPAVRDLVKSGKVKVVGAIYDMHTGGVNWLPADKVAVILKSAEASPDRALNAMYDKNSTSSGAESAGQDVAPRIRELASLIDSKTGEAALELKDMKGKLDSLASQMRAVTDNTRNMANDAGTEAAKALASDIRAVRTGFETKTASLESANSMIFWVLVSFAAVFLLCFCWIVLKLGSLGNQQEQLRGELKNVLDRLNKL